MTVPFSRQIRTHVKRCGVSRYRIASEIGCSQTLLGLFVHGARGLSLPMLDKLAALLQLEVVMHGPALTVLNRLRRKNRLI